MSPATLSIVLAAIVLLFVLNGFFQGLIHMLGSIVGLVIGIGVASRLDTSWGAWLTNATGWDKNICVIVAFVIILLIFTRLFGFALHILEKTFRFMKIPLIGLANRLSGGVLGFFEGVLVVGATLIIIRTLPFASFVKTLNASDVAGSLMAAAILILPLLPKSVRALYEVS